MDICKTFVIAARWCYQWVRPKPEYYHKVNSVGVEKSNGSEPPLIISLTSFPARISTVRYTIESIFLQRKKANRVILWLAEEQFPKKEKELPKSLIRLCRFGLEIRWCHDIHSYKKLIPALREFPEDIIVTIDDDIWYPPLWLENLYHSYKNKPNFVHADRALKVKISNDSICDYSSWEMHNYGPQKPSFRWHLTGCGGVLYPPHSLHPDVLKEDIFMNIANKVDDIWFWSMAILQGTKICIPDNNIFDFEGVFIVNNQSLWSENYFGRNDEALIKIVEKYPIIKDRLIRDNW